MERRIGSWLCAGVIRLRKVGGWFHIQESEYAPTVVRDRRAKRSWTTVVIRGEHAMAAHHCIFRGAALHACGIRLTPTLKLMLKRVETRKKTVETPGGTYHVVGIGDLRVLVVKREGYWFARGIDINYAAQGRTL